MAPGPLRRILTGGQTGVDRGGLDAALALGFPCGGWCPEGRRAEDGPIPDRYPLRELPGGGYDDRTLRNVLDSDGTALVVRGEVLGGTRTTLAFCLAHDKPFRLLDAELAAPERLAAVLAAFVETHGIATLNVAGPRASEWPEAAQVAMEVVASLLGAGLPPPASHLETDSVL